MNPIEANAMESDFLPPSLAMLRKQLYIYKSLKDLEIRKLDFPRMLLSFNKLC